MDKVTQNAIKARLGQKAVELIDEGMVVGLGTGSTAECLIESLIKKCQQGLTIRAVSSSLRSMEMAQKGGISVIDINETPVIDLTIDGADEVDPQYRLIKGRGGALVREKILASSSKKMIVIIDESKLVPVLGQGPLPVEIIPFGYKATIAKINRLGYKGKLREQDMKPYMTDNGNFIFDITPSSPFHYPEEDHKKIIGVPGVVDTGFFFGLASDIIIGYANGNVKLQKIK